MGCANGIQPPQDMKNASSQDHALTQNEQQPMYVLPKFEKQEETQKEKQNLQEDAQLQAQILDEPQVDTVIDAGEAQQHVSQVSKPIQQSSQQSSQCNQKLSPVKQQNEQGEKKKKRKVRSIIQRANEFEFNNNEEALNVVYKPRNAIDQAESHLNRDLKQVALKRCGSDNNMKQKTDMLASGM